MAKIKPTPSTLFPILNSHPGPRLLGIARLAAESTHTDDGHLIDFRSLQPRTILNKSVSKRGLRHSWSINPFRGCEFGCKYCYARYTHEFLQPAPITTPPPGTHDIPQQPWALAFEREIYLKENAAWLLEQELRTIGIAKPKRSPSEPPPTPTNPSNAASASPAPSSKSSPAKKASASASSPSPRSSPATSTSSSRSPPATPSSSTSPSPPPTQRSPASWNPAPPAPTSASPPCASSASPASTPESSAAPSSPASTTASPPSTR